MHAPAAMTRPNTRPRRPKRGNVVSRVSTSGSLQAVVTVDVGSQVSGRIQELYADFNSPVKKGEMIAKIDPSLFQAAVVQAEANVTAARANVTRLTVTAEDAERQAKRASEGLRAAAHLRDRTRQRGGHGARRARRASTRPQGQLAQSRAAARAGADQPALHRHPVAHRWRGDLARRERRARRSPLRCQAPVIFTIAQDLRKMEVHTNVAESDIGRLKPGMRVSFTVDAYPGEPFRGSIRDIRNAPQVVQNVVTYDAVIDVANDDLKLKPGMTATVSIVTDRRRDVLAVPNAALRFRPEGAPPAGRDRRRPAQRGRLRRRARAAGGNAARAEAAVAQEARR